MHWLTRPCFLRKERGFCFGWVRHVAVKAATRRTCCGAIAPRDINMLIKALKPLFIITAFFLSVTIVCAGSIDGCKEYSKLGLPGTQGDLPL